GDGNFVVGTHSSAGSGPYKVTITVKGDGFTVKGTATAFDPTGTVTVPQTAGKLPVVGVPSGPLHHGHRGNSHWHHRSHLWPAHHAAGLDRFEVHKGNRPAQTGALRSALLQPIRDFANRRWVVVRRNRQKGSDLAGLIASLRC